MVLDDLRPVDLGLDAFAEFRHIQLQAIEQILYSDERFVGLALPAGAGKSLVAAAIPKLTGWRTVLLTSSRGLQAQYATEFPWFYPISGRQNYPCTSWPPENEVNCDEGALLGCPKIGLVHRTDNCKQHCTYEVRREQARRSDTVQSNYSFWFNVNNFQSSGLVDRSGSNPFDCLILDESHSAPNHLSDYLHIEMSESDLRLLGLQAKDHEKIDSIPYWALFARDHLPDLKFELNESLKQLRTKSTKSPQRELSRVKRLSRFGVALELIQTMNSEEWIGDYQEGTRYGRTWSFDAVWPGRYAEQYLFRNIPKVVLLSATLRPRTMELLWIPKRDSIFREWPRIFDANRCPIYFLPPTNPDTGKAIRIDRRTTDTALLQWVDHIDSIIDPRSDRKALITTVSYQRARFLMDHSRHADRMIGNTGEPDSATAMETFEAHVYSGRPTILVSPSFSTGWNFKDDAARLIIVCKIAFPDGRSKLMQARTRTDEHYANFLAMLDLVQACGRGMRHDQDWCEVFLTDGHASWFLYRFRHFAPLGFVNSIRRPERLPRPLQL